MNQLEEASLDEILLNGSVEEESNAATPPRFSAVSSLSHQHSAREESTEKETPGNQQGPARQGEETRTCCRICRVVDDRPLLRFKADLSSQPNNDNSSKSLKQDITLHLFCGKTAAILQSQPDLEILTKAGLKNKHGTGQEINAALSRTRSATVDNKEYFLVREFEAHLAAGKAPTLLRQTFVVTSSQLAAVPPHANGVLHATNDQFHNETSTTRTATTPKATAESSPPSINSPTSDDPIIQSLLQSASNSNLSAMTEQTAPYTDPSDSNKRMKVSCPCGGSHLSTNSQAGVQSFRAHVASPVHQQWLREQTTNSKRDKDALAATSTTAV